MKIAATKAAAYRPAHRSHPRGLLRSVNKRLLRQTDEGALDKRRNTAVPYVRGCETTCIAAVQRIAIGHEIWEPTVVVGAECQFSNTMSSSHLKCRRDVIYDMKVRIRGRGVVCGRCRAIGLLALRSRPVAVGRR